MEGAGTSTQAMFLLFGANATLFACLWTHSRLATKEAPAESSELASTPKNAHKQLSQPLVLSLASITELSKEFCKLGALLVLAWLCEHRPLFDHQKKTHDMDMYWFMAFALAVISFANIRKSKGGDILNREQTEEWKGWMQFAFLMYHYFSASEVYNVIRVLITAYVWMTGFGNFSFFYMREDYTAVRVIQMMWRLNFLVMCLCMVMGNSYILYYICPLHTFYFLFTYVVMRLLPKTNYQEWSVRLKLLGFGILIYCVWDLDLGLFKALFFWLGTAPEVGATSGTQWEWYFRSSLDHWSTFLGMIYALNFPLSALWMKKVEAMPARRQWLIKGSVAATLAVAFMWWAAVVLPQPKLQYNLSNAYFGVPIPLLTYVFWRNLTPTLRTHYMEPLHSIGKITLETYLMQHHVWLTSNAKTTLILAPSYPRLNILLAGVMYVLVSQELHRLTMSLRGMLLPDHLGKCLRNLAAMGALLGAAYLGAGALESVGGGWGALLTTSFVVGGAAIVLVHCLLLRAAAAPLAVPTTDNGADDVSLQQLGGTDAAAGGGAAPYDGKMLQPSRLLPAALAASLALLAFATAGARTPTAEAAAAAAARDAIAAGPHHLCVRAVNNGLWATTTGTCSFGDAEGQHATVGYCNSYAWEWVDVPDQCHLHFIPSSEMATALAGKEIVLAGDSIQRFLYYAMIRSMGFPTPAAHDDTVPKHTNLSWVSPDGTIKIHFLWAPTIAELNVAVPAYLEDTATPLPQLLVAGVGLWDALNEHDPAKYGEGVEEFAKQLQKMDGGGGGSGPLKVWVKITSVSEGRLMTPDKQLYLTEAAVRAYQSAADATSLEDSVHSLLDGHALTAQRASDSYDGVHYPDFVYDALQQLLGNVLEHYGWSGGAAGDGGRRRELGVRGVGLSGLDGELGGGAAFGNGGDVGSGFGRFGSFGELGGGLGGDSDAEGIEDAEEDGGGSFFPRARKLASADHKVGSMGDPWLGAMVLAIAAVMLFVRDAYDGLPALALRLFGSGVRLSWQEAYGPLLAKLGKGPALSHSGRSPSPPRTAVGVELSEGVARRLGGLDGASHRRGAAGSHGGGGNGGNGGDGDVCGDDESTSADELAKLLMENGRDIKPRPSR